MKNFYEELENKERVLNIKLKDLELSQSKESYLKVLGAIEIVQFLKKEVEHPPEEDPKIDIAEVT